MTLEQFLKGEPLTFIDLRGRPRVAAFKASRDVGLTFMQFETPEGRVLMQPIMGRPEAENWYRLTTSELPK